MTLAVDANILLDVLADDPKHADSSQRLLRRAHDAGALVICDVVHAELSPQFDSQHLLDQTLRQPGIRLVASGSDVAYIAGRKWSGYRRRGGSRNRVLPDFLVGAHDQLRADRLLTRDRGFHSSCFTNLVLLQS